MIIILINFILCIKGRTDKSDDLPGAFYPAKQRYYIPS